jgi:hypothetical protein
MIRRWWFSLFLAGVYPGTFQFWMISERRATVLSGLLVTTVTGVVFGWAARRGYFLNRWDGVIHAAVIADIFLEAVLVPAHEQRSFYLCALGFALVATGYRVWLSRTKLAVPSSES